jgi:hypothetical protein
MYWPIGAPRIYAASSSRTPRARVIQFDDDAESRETTEGSGSLINAPSSASDAQDEEDPRSGLLTPVTPVTPGIPKPVEYDAAQRRLSARALGSLDEKLEDVITRAEGEHILALKISRSGHLFAVITATSLTVWQTKVCSFPDNIGSRVLTMIANCHIGCCGAICHILNEIWT